MTRKLCCWTTTVALVAGLCACGGGGGIDPAPPPVPGPTPTPAPTPTPTPTPPPTPTPAAVPLAGVTQDFEFATAGDAIQIRWDEQAKSYDIKLPGSDWATLVPGTNGLFDVSLVNSAGTRITGASFGDLDGYNYTATLTLVSESGYEKDKIAFGIPTAAADMPVTGTATYLGQLDGYDGADAWISGDAKFQFDFGAGTLAGYIHPHANGGWTGGDLGQYDFVNTVYSTGSPSFSGDLLNAVNAMKGTFGGNFNGPGAPELMSKWMIQFNMCDISWCDPASPTSSVSGIIVGKKQ